MMGWTICLIAVVPCSFLSLLFIMASSLVLHHVSLSSTCRPFPSFVLMFWLLVVVRSGPTPVSSYIFPTCCPYLMSLYVLCRSVKSLCTKGLLMILSSGFLCACWHLLVMFSLRALSCRVVPWSWSYMFPISLVGSSKSYPVIWLSGLVFVDNAWLADPNNILPRLLSGEPLRVSFRISGSGGICGWSRLMLSRPAGLLDMMSYRSCRLLMLSRDLLVPRALVQPCLWHTR